MTDYSKLYIDGAWVPSDGTETIDVINPSTEQVIASVPAGTADRRRPGRRRRQGRLRDVGLHVQGGAGQVHPGHRRGPGGPQRGDRRGRSPTRWACRSMWANMIQAGLPVGNMAGYQQILDDFEFEEQVGNSLVVREPIGVVGAITPWNYPLHQIIAKVAPALAAGCTVVLKPSEVTPLDAFILAEVIDSVGLPAGVFNLVTGTGPVVGEAIASHPDVDMVSFTGSTRAGKRVTELGAQTVKRVAPRARRQVGQRLPRRRRPRGRRAVERHVRLLPQLGPDLLGAHPHGRAPRQAGRDRGAWPRPRPSRSSLGPGDQRRTSSARSCRPPSATGCAATSRRASTRAPRSSPVASSAPEGLDTGYFVQPTIFADVTSDMTIAQEEIFGPVLVDHALRRRGRRRSASPTARCTACRVRCSRPTSSGPRPFARQMRTGQVDINGAPTTSRRRSVATASRATAVSSASSASTSSSRRSRCSSRADPLRTCGGSPGQVPGSDAGTGGTST